MIRQFSRAVARQAARLLAGLVAMLLAAAVLGVSVLGASPAGAESATQDDDEASVVLIGVPGLAWEDITDATPNMQLLTGESTASLIVRSVRTTSCPADGWLAISAGNRAADLPGPCRVLAEPRGGGQVPGWQDYQTSASDLSYRARIGTFGQALADQGIDAAGIGPGAAIALADPQGDPGEYYQRNSAGVALSTQVITAARDVDLLVIDAGSLRPVPREFQEWQTDETRPLTNPLSPEAFRAAQLQLIDRRVDAILTGLRSGGDEPTVMLAGLSDDGAAALRVLAVSGPEAEQALGVSSSTRQSGYVLATDLLPTLVSMLDGQRLGGDVIGAPISFEPTDLDAEERRELLIDQDLHAQSVRPIVPSYYLVLVIMNLALFATMAIGLRRPLAERLRTFLQRRVPAAAKRLDAFTMHRSKVLRVMRIAALSIAALPVASFLANLLPWWRNTPPALGLAVYTALFVALLVVVALAGPWRRHILGAPTVIAAVTALVLIVDIATGARLQVSAVMGISTLVAGRMYGMNNTAFTLYTVSTLLVTIAIANHLVQRGRRLLAALITAAIGAAVALFDGAPSLGADFGGPPALLPAYALLALMAAGVRLSLLRIGAVLVGSAVATFAFAFVDWLRPAEDHTHLGRFFQTVLDGGIWDVIWRKLGQNLTILWNNRPLTLLAVFGVLTVIFVFARPIRGAIIDRGTPDSISGGTPLSQMGKAAPMLPPGIVCIGVALALGMAVNDSGVAIPAVGVAVGVPLLVAACTTWMIELNKANGGGPEASALTDHAAARGATDADGDRSGDDVSGESAVPDGAADDAEQASANP